MPERDNIRRIYLESKFRDEAKLQAALLEILKDLGFEFRYHTHDSRRSEEGFPDVVAINPTAGVLWVAELKGLQTPTRPRQREWLDAWRSVRRLIVPDVVHPADYDRVVDQLTAAVHGDRIVR